MRFSWTRGTHHQKSTALIALLSPLSFRTNAITATEEENKKTDSQQCSPLIANHSPLTPIRLFRPNDNLEIAFDARTRTPVYVLQRLDPNTTPPGNEQQRRRRHFFEEKSLPEEFRSRNSYYHKSGYDRGHLAPAADFYNPQQQNDTYNLINVAPQHHDMNRKIWARLEKWTRAVARGASGSDNNCETWVVTGPLWLPYRQTDPKRFEYRYPGLGVPPSLVAVPTHFFKVIVVMEKAKKSTTSDEPLPTVIRKFACFVVPNDDSSAHNDRHLQDYLVRWTDLEAVSGLVFFPSVASKAFKDRSDVLTNQFLSRPSSVPLLMDNGGNNKTASRMRKGSSSFELYHLCQEHACCPPYNRIKRLQVME